MRKVMIKRTVVLLAGLRLVMGGVQAGDGRPKRAAHAGEVVFLNGRQELRGSLVLPRGPGPFPVVVFVHGDGPADRSAHGYFSQFFKAFSDAGIASFSWDKPGAGRSTNLFTGWRRQTMSDRMEETRRAIDCLKTRKEIDPRRIGLWGISQAGSVMPSVCIDVKPAFMIAVSCPGMTGADQSAYHLGCSLRHQGFSEEETREAVGCFREILDLWGRKLPHGDFMGDYEKLTKPRQAKKWFMAHPFLKAPVDPNWYGAMADTLFSDPAPVLRRLECPVLAFFGEKDENIDARADLVLYEKALRESKSPDWKTVMVPDVAHLLVARNLGVPPLVMETMVEFARKHFD